MNEARCLATFWLCLAGGAAALWACGDDGASSPSPPDTPLPAAACEGVSLRGLTPTAARFAPGEDVVLGIDATTTSTAPCEVTIDLAISHAGAAVDATSTTLALQPGDQRVELGWTAPAEDFIGYLAQVSVRGTEGAVGTGIDVSSSPLRYPRYGYISVFPAGQSAETSQQIVSVLAERYHLNLFQMYDWFWRHEDLIRREADGSVAESWTDLFGRVNEWMTIRDLVDAIHRENGLAMAYVTIYAAREGYEQLSGVSPGWGLFETPQAEAQSALAFGGDRYLFLFDPSNAQWQMRMASEYIEAILEGGFDGVHIDQFGPRPTLYRVDGTPVELRDTFAPFLQVIDAALGAAVPDRDACIFNLVDGIVDGYAVEQVATSSACDVLYSEIWFANDTYESLRAYIEQLRGLGGGRPVVLAVYPQYGEDVGVILEAESATLEGVEVASAVEDASAGAYVSGFDAVGDALEWSFDLSEDATVSFVFRYANESGEPATRAVLVDGQPVGKVTFSARGTSEWAFDAWVQARFPAGPHRVRLSYEADDTGSALVDRLTLGEFDEDSVRLQNAVIFASGASPILIGDDVQSLSHEYFPNRSKSLRPSLARALELQFSFITAHERLLFGPEVEPIDERLELVQSLSGQSLIAEGVGGVWTVLRRAPEGELIHLVNLVGVDNARWRDAAPTPEPQENLRLRVEVDDAASVREVLWATPDEGTGAFESLPFSVSDDAIEIEIPRLAYWDVVLVRR